MHPSRDFTEDQSQNPRRSPRLLIIIRLWHQREQRVVSFSRAIGGRSLQPRASDGQRIKEEPLNSLKVNGCLARRIEELVGVADEVLKKNVDALRSPEPSYP